MSITIEECAQTVLTTVPSLMQAIRAEMRQGRMASLTVPQFRTLVLAEGAPGPSMSRVAEHVGLTLPSATALVDGLVERGLVVRQPHPSDRRCVQLALTEAGRREVREARQHTLAMLTERLAGLDEAERAGVVRALTVLRLALQTQEAVR